MDPVTAFGLAAGVLQCLDVGFRAVTTCRELYQDKSLAQHRETQEITEDLAETTKRLQESLGRAPTALSKESKDVVDVSIKCSRTATELLTELKKLQLKPGGGLRQAIGKTVRSLQRKKFLEETQAKLERYQSILNTRILTKLDAHTVKQDSRFSDLDQSTRDLAIALSKGLNTVQGLLAEHTVAIQTHVDYRISDLKKKEAKQRALQVFKDSLFFPEIFARQENIAKSHEGTCHWIFGTPRSGSESSSASDPDNDTVDSDATIDTNGQPYVGDGHDDARPQAWSNFKDWLLEDSSNPYWLNGKPGSGKSTLMKYILTEFLQFWQSEEALSAGTTPKDIIICSFFFWSLGSSLQKTYDGLLRSLLYQIVEQRGDMMPIIMDHSADSRANTDRVGQLSQLPTWTETRLDDALRRLLRGKPASLRLYMFIDGLDEFEGDEDCLMEVVRLLSKANGIRVCVSSRPEQIFRQGFAYCPQLKLQDLNYFDIKKATSKRLYPVLENRYSLSKSANQDFIKQVINKSQGIFLWAELMTKDLKRGALNADSMEELYMRLERTPDTIRGLYKHMFDQLDRSYLRDATRYFQYLVAYQNLFAESSPSGPTLLHFACCADDAWSHLTSKDYAYFESSKIADSCRPLEVHIMTRCANLVEVDVDRQDILHAIDDYRDCCLETDKGDGSLARHLREVRFIHKTVVEFLQNHSEFFKDVEWEMAASLAAVRSQIVVASLTPSLVSESTHAHYTVNMEFMEDVMTAFWPADGCLQATRVSAFEIVDQTFKFPKSLHGSDCTLEECYGDLGWDHGYLMHIDWGSVPEPFLDCLGFATFFGRHDYVAQSLATSDNYQESIEHVLCSALDGLCSCCEYEVSRLARGTISKRFRGLLRILKEYILHSTCTEWQLSTGNSHAGAQRASKWDLFFVATSTLLATFNAKVISYRSPNPDRVSELSILWTEIMALFFTNINLKANPNTVVAYTRFVLVEKIRGSPTFKLLELATHETLLAYIVRLELESGPLGNILGPLRVHGGLHRTHHHAIRYVVEERRKPLIGSYNYANDNSNDDSDDDSEDNSRGFRQNAWCYLTQDQSERLMQGKLTKKLWSKQVRPFPNPIIHEESMPTQPDPRAEEIVQLVLDGHVSDVY